MEKLLAFFEALNEKQKAIFLVRIAHELTIVGRATYMQGKIQEPEQLVKVNEFQHRLSGMISDHLQNKHVRDDSEMIRRIFLGYEELQASGVLGELVRRSRKLMEAEAQRG
jgi:hypothetical protein